MTTPKHNILFVCDFPFAGAGGVGRVTETLAAEFVRRGHRVTYLSLSAGEDRQDAGIRQLFAPCANGIASPEMATWLEGLLRDLQVDVIINQGGVKPEIIRLFSMVDRGSARLLSVHHNSVAALQENYQQILVESYRGRKISRLLATPAMGPFLRLYNRMKLGNCFKKALHHSDRLILLSPRFIPELGIYLGNSIPREKVSGIPNPAPFAIVEGAGGMKKNRLLYVGRVERQQKRCDLLVELWKQIYRKYPDWTLDVVGDGAARQELESLVKAEGLERIVFHGYQDPRRYLEKAKLFCMTSAYEGYGMVLVEAQAYGVVPLAFDCFSALPDIIETGRNGYVLPKFDLDAYAGKLESLMTNELLRQEMACAGRETVLKFMPASIGDQWEAFFCGR